MAKSDSNAPLTDEQKRGKAYNAASLRLREKYRDEFNTMMAEEARKVGVEWKPRPTEAQKAAAKITALLAQVPEDQRAGLLGVGQSPTPPQG